MRLELQKLRIIASEIGSSSPGDNSPTSLKYLGLPQSDDDSALYKKIPYNGNPNKPLDTMKIESDSDESI